MKIKTSELTGKALDWSVIKCEEPIGGYKPWFKADFNKGIFSGMNYSSDWLWGGEIIEREKIDILQSTGRICAAIWEALPGDRRLIAQALDCHTPLVAAMRCYVASKLGDEVEVPDGLV